MRSLVIALLLLAAVALALPAAAGDLFGSNGNRRGGLARATGHESPRHRARTEADSLRRFTERRKAEAGVRLLEQHRDAERRWVAARLRSSGSPAQVRAYRARVEAREQTDNLRIDLRLAQVDRAWWNSLGPNTRRVFASSGVVVRPVFEDRGIAVRRAQRRQQLRRDLDDLEHAVETRELPSTW
jgi:hypothetical protein